MSLTVKIGFPFCFLAVYLFCIAPVSGQAPLPVPGGPGGPPVTKEMQNDMVYHDALKARLTDDDKQAEILFKEFVKTNPKGAAGYYNLAKISMKQQKMEQASDYIKMAVSLEPGNPWYKAQYAEILGFRHEYEQAADIFAELAASEKYNQDYLLKAALYYQNAKKYAKALVAMDKLIAKLGEDEDYLMQKQQIFLRMNDLDGAVKVAARLIELNPKEGRYYANLAELYDSNKQPGKAVEIFEKAEKMFPDDPAIQLSLAEHYKRQNNIAKYDEFEKKVILNKGLDAETQMGIYMQYLQDLNGDSVRRKKGVHIQMASELALQHPDNPQVLAVYGQVLGEADQQEKAIEQFKKAVAIDPSRYIIWEALLRSYTEPSKSDSLILYSEKAMRYFPNQAMVHYLNGIGYYNKKEYPKAVKSVNRAIDLQPEEQTQLLSGMYSTLGDIYNFSKEYTLSDSSYEKALRLEPRDAGVLNNYSYYLSVRGVRLEQAEKMSKLSLEIRPGEATFLDTYGWILYKQGKYTQAKEYIENALKANPDADGTLYEHLGDVQYKLQNTEKAVEYWKKAKEKGADNALIDKKIQERKLYE